MIIKEYWNTENCVCIFHQTANWKLLNATPKTELRRNFGISCLLRSAKTSFAMIIKKFKNDKMIYLQSPQMISHEVRKSIKYQQMYWVVLVYSKYILKNIPLTFREPSLLKVSRNSKSI